MLKDNYMFSLIAAQECFNPFKEGEKRKYSIPLSFINELFPFLFLKTNFLMLNTDITFVCWGNWEKKKSSSL